MRVADEPRIVGPGQRGRSCPASSVDAAPAGRPRTLLEALAHSRRCQGLPAAVVNLGGIGEVGFVARHQGVAKRLSDVGLELTPPQLAIELIERTLLDGSVQRFAGVVDWQQVLQVMPRSAALIE